MTKKFQIFVSSTFRDLVDERQDTIRSILDLGHIPSGMEIFPAADIQQFEYIKKVIDECDYYTLIIGARYGSVDAEGISFTEKEYAYAVEKGIPVLAFIHGDVQSLPVSRSDIDPAVVERLNRFRSRVSDGRLVRFWKTRDELKAQVIVSLAKAANEFPAIGWIRGDAVASEALLWQINDLRNQNDELKSTLNSIKEASTPAFDDIADFDSVFVLRIETYNSNGANHKQKIEMTWRAIFRAVAPDLATPKWASHLPTALKSYVDENAGLTRRVTSIYDSDIDTIRLQLIAYGLIKAFSSNKQGGGADLAIELTPMGHRRLAEILVVRK